MDQNGKKTQHEEDSDRGDKDYDSDAPDDEDDDVEEFSSDEVEQDEWEVERIIRSDWNFERQQYFYLVVVRGSHLVEEWISEDDMNGGPIYDAFVAERDRASVAKRSAVAASSFRAINTAISEQERGEEVACAWCEKLFKKRGLSAHQKKM